MSDAGRPYTLTLKCNYCGCQASINSVKHASAMRMMEENGWTKKVQGWASRILCPDCTLLVKEYEGEDEGEE